MKYIKTIVIFFISLNLSALCAENATSISTDIQNAGIQVETDAIPVEKDASTADDSWTNHLTTLKDNWNNSTNAPDSTWTARAIEIAVAEVKTNKDSAEKLKSEFLDAINTQSTKFTADTIAAVAEFNDAVDKELGLSKPVVETTEESTSITSTKEVVPAQETQQVSTDETTTTEKPTSSETTSSTANSTPSTESTTKSEKTETPQEEEKENLIEEWNNCLSKIQRKQGNLDRLTDEAIELAQNLKNPRKNPKPMKATELTQAFERALLVRGLPPVERDSALSSFASALGIYMPTPETPTNYYDQPTESELAMLQQQEELEEMQRKQMEQDERIEAAEREAEHQRMIAQAATLDAVRKQQLSVDQWQKTQDSLMKAEQRKLAQLEQEANQLKEKTRELEAQLKKTAEKSYLTRAKETVSELIWGPSETAQSPEKIAQQKKQLEQQLANKEKEVAREQKELTAQKRRKKEQAERAEELRALTGHVLTEAEQKRKAELEAEQREALQTANLNNFELQKKEWPTFIRSIKNMENPTREDNNRVTAEAIEKATSLLNLASKMPFVNMIELEQMLKETFARALVSQKQKKQHTLNVAVKQDQFNNAINQVVDEVAKSTRLKYFQEKLSRE